MPQTPPFNPFGKDSKTGSVRWQLPDSLKQAAITRLAMMIADIKQRPRVVIAAIRAVVEISKIEAAIEMQRQVGEQDFGDEMPQVIFTAKTEMEELRSLPVSELLELIDHPAREIEGKCQKRAEVSDEARARADRSLQAIQRSELESGQVESKPKAKILPHPRPDDSR